MLGSIGSTELLLILVVALLVLGPKSLANMARSVGKVVGEFRRVSTDFQRTLNAEVALEEEKEKRQKAEKEVAADLQQQAVAPTAAAAAAPPVTQAGNAASEAATAAADSPNSPGPQAGQDTATVAVATASDDNGDAAESDSLAPPPGSPLDVALKRAAAEAEAAGATELMQVETVKPEQGGQAAGKQASA